MKMNKSAMETSTNSNYKILLITINNLWRYSNIGVDQIAGYLRLKGYHVDIMYHHKRMRYDEIKEKLELRYDLYGFSVNSSNYTHCMKLISYIKKHQPSALTIFGGGYPTRYYREIYLKTEDLDYVVLGDGEHPLENLLEHLNKSQPLTYLNNIATKIDLNNKLPYCNRQINYLPAFDYYIKDRKIINARKEYCIQSKNNVCTGKCSFCTERKGSVVYKEISHIVDEIKFVAENYGVKKFFFTDDNIFDPNNSFAKLRIKELCLEIEKLNLNLVFKCYSKSISLSDTKDDNELLELMSRVGFKTVFVGIESGNEADLRLYNKNVRVEDNYTILKLLKRHGIVPQIGFINFNPYSTLQSIRENFTFMSNIEMSNLFMYVCSYLRVYKYTEIHYKMEKDGLLLDDHDYLDDNSLYKFQDDDAKKIFDFIYDYMIDRVRNFDFEFDWLFSFFNECKKLNSKSVMFEEELKFMHINQYKKIHEFFYMLFEENNLLWCERKVDEFLSYFEGLQPRMLEIYDELLELYLEA